MKQILWFLLEFFWRWPLLEQSPSSCHHPRTDRKNCQQKTLRGPQQGILNDMAAWYLVKLVMHCHSLRLPVWRTTKVCCNANMKFRRVAHSESLQDMVYEVGFKPLGAFEGCRCLEYLLIMTPLWHRKSTFTSRSLWATQRSGVDTWFSQNHLKQAARKID